MERLDVYPVYFTSCLRKNCNIIDGDNGNIINSDNGNGNIVNKFLELPGII